MPTKSGQSSIYIRDALIGDAEIIADFNCRMALESENRHLDPAIVLTGVRKGIEQRDICRFFVAEYKGQIVGQAMVTYEWSDWRCSMFWWIQSVYIHHLARRQGIFKTIYSHIVTLARQSQGVCGLRLYVEKDNSKAIATYERLGMKPSGHILYETVWSDGENTPSRDSASVF